MATNPGSSGTPLARISQPEWPDIRDRAWHEWHEFRDSEDGEKLWNTIQRIAAQYKVNADDLEQDTYLELFIALAEERYRKSKGPLLAYAIGIANNKARRMAGVRSQKKGTRSRPLQGDTEIARSTTTTQETYPGDSYWENIPDTRCLPEQIVSRRDQFHQAEQAVALLSKQEQEAVQLVGRDEMSEKVAAHVLGVSYANLRQILLRARKRLKKLLGAEWGTA